MFHNEIIHYLTLKYFNTNYLPEFVFKMPTDGPFRRNNGTKFPTKELYTYSRDAIAESTFHRKTTISIS